MENKPVEIIQLICSDMNQNNNKFWYGELYEDDTVITKWGRVGNTPQSKTFPNKGRKFLITKRNEKKRKGYTELKVINESATTGSYDTDSLAKIARKQIKTTNPLVLNLIDRLIKANIHNITSNTNITYNNSTGLFSTPLGIVTLEGISEARDILNSIKSTDKDGSEWTHLINRYLRIIPQSIGMRFEVDHLFGNIDALVKQNDLLDSLETSYMTLQEQRKDSNKNHIEDEKLFDVDLDVMDASSYEYNNIKNWFKRTNHTKHGYKNVTIKNIYCVSMKDNIERFTKTLEPLIEVFHGTSEANLLSILKSGIQISPPSTANITGKLFGNGVYGAIDSSKSLQYSMGRFGGMKGTSAWIFVLDFAMGNVFYPKTYGTSKIPKNYDSCWAKASNTGLRYDELIVYKINQVKIKYLIELQ